LGFEKLSRAAIEWVNLVRNELFQIRRRRSKSACGLCSSRLFEPGAPGWVRRCLAARPSRCAQDSGPLWCRREWINGPRGFENEAVIEIRGRRGLWLKFGWRVAYGLRHEVGPAFHRAYRSDFTIWLRVPSGRSGPGQTGSEHSGTAEGRQENGRICQDSSQTARIAV
jgi:hypothetical protein